MKKSNKKLPLGAIKIQSFVTSLENDKMITIKGGETMDLMVCTNDSFGISCECLKVHLD